MVSFFADLMFRTEFYWCLERPADRTAARTSTLRLTK